MSWAGGPDDVSGDGSVSEHERERAAARRFEASGSLTPERERAIRGAVQGAEPYGSTTPAWMVIALLAEVDRLRSAT